MSLQNKSINFFQKSSFVFFLCIFSLKYSVLSCKYHIPQGASDFIFKQLLYCVCVHQENRRLIGHVMMVTHVHLWCQGQSGVSERRQSQVSPQTRPCLCVSRKTQDVCWRGAEERWTPNQQSAEKQEPAAKQTDGGLERSKEPTLHWNSHTEERL